MLQLQKPQEVAGFWGNGKGKSFGCFLKWWYPSTMGFPTKNDHFGVEIGGTPIFGNTHLGLIYSFPDNHGSGKWLYLRGN